MWPEWSAWTWWGIALALTPLLVLPTIWDNRAAIWMRVPPWRWQCHSAHAAFTRNPGNGPAAAKVIERVSSTARAISVYHEFMAAAHRTNEESVRYALADRFRKEGPSDAALEFLNAPPAIEKRRREYDDSDSTRYEWDILLFVRQEPPEWPRS